MINPLLSIVIANYNYGRFLSEALESVINQCDSPKLLSGEAILPITERASCGIELLICDGGSQDESVEVIKKYSNYIAWWCSERDGGQSEAFNKGFAHAKGEWITWLNADDLYLEGTFKAFADLVARSPNAEWVTGNKVHYDSVTNKICSVNWGPHIMPPLLSRNRASSASFGPSAFWKKKLYARLGGIDETMHYAMDTQSLWLDKNLCLIYITDIVLFQQATSKLMSISTMIQALMFFNQLLHVLVEVQHLFNNCGN